MRLALLALVSACSFPDLVHHDNDAGQDAGPDANPTSVTGTSKIGYILFDGTVQMVAEDLSRYTIKAYLPNGDDTFTVIPVEGTAQGTFEIPNVPPDTTYFLSLEYPEIANVPVPTPEIIVSDKRVLDLGYPTVGRPDAVETHLASQVVLNLSNMVAWTNNDYLLVDSFNAGTEFGDFSRAANTPMAGATTVTGLSYDWRDGGSVQIGRLPSLIDASKGDDFFVAHGHGEMRGTGKQVYSVNHQVGVIKRTDLMQVDGSPLTVTAPFEQITLDKQVSVTIQLEDFRSRMADRQRIVVEGISVLEVDGPATQYQNTIGPGPWGIDLGNPSLFMRGIPDVFTPPPITYGTTTTYPSSWPRIVFTNYRTFRSFRLPGATTAGTLAIPHQVYTPFGTNNVIAAPSVRAPTMITIGGVESHDEPMAVPFDGTHGVVVDWDDIVQADGYDVIVDHLFLDGTATSGKRIAQMRTEESRAVLPPDLFKRGDRYVVGVYAIKGLDDAGPRRFRLPGGYTGRATSAVLFSDKCGDGVTDTDLGEECDTMGATASCDADCSFPVCGDAYTNTLAGETCDHGRRDSFGCDADCTAVVCGDGRWNRIAEDCDDGNTADSGNGCSTTCTRTGTCGDGVVQGFFETCDPPDGTTCGPDCHQF